MRIKEQKGMVGLEVALVLVVLVLVGFVAVRTYDVRHQAAVSAPLPSPTAKPYVSVQDLDTAQAALASTNLDTTVDGDDLSGLEQELNNF